MGKIGERRQINEKKWYGEEWDPLTYFVPHIYIYIIIKLKCNLDSSQKKNPRHYYKKLKEGKVQINLLHIAGLWNFTRE